ncbi:unnamed protein product, partial [Trichogramma brassicae]
WAACMYGLGARKVVHVLSVQRPILPHLPSPPPPPPPPAPLPLQAADNSTHIIRIPIYTMCRDVVESSLGCLFAPTTSLYHSFLRYRRGLRRRRARHDRHRCYQCRRKYHWSLFREQQLRDDTDRDNELDQFGRHVAAADARLSCINHLLLRMCIEGLLEQDSGFCSNEVPVVNSLKDCIDLLWSEVHDKSVLKEMELAIEDFEKGHKSLDKECLQMQRDLVSMLAKSLRILMKDSRLRERTIESRYFLQTIKIAIESFVLHGLRKLLPQAVALGTAHEDATLNKVIKNLYDLQLKDLSVRPDLYDGVNRGKQELSRLEGHFTVLGKLGCLKRAVRLVSQGESSVSSDDLLPVLIFLVVKSGLASWCAQLAFMKNFRYSASAGHDSDEAGFLVTSLEAAVEHVKSGSLRLGNGSGGSREDLTEHGPKLNGQSSIPIYENINGDEDHNLFGNGYGDCNGLDKQTSELFEHARKGNVVEVQRIMNEKSSGSSNNANDKDSKLCHPLCLCERCQRKMSSNKRFGLDGTPSITARDERGRTCLHVAALHGQVAVVDYLLNRGAKTSLADADGATALHCAAARGHQNTLLMLLHAGADPNAQDSRGNTPLHLAADHGHDACVKTLLFFGEHSRMPISVSATNVQGDTALHFASKWGYSGIVELLMEHGADVQARNRRGQTPMTLAHSNLVAKLLEAQPSMKKCSTVGCNGTIHKETGTKKRTTQANSTMKPGTSTTKKHGYRGGGLTEGMHKIDRLFAAVAEGDIRLASYYLGLEGPLSKTFVTEHDSPKFCHPLCNCDKCVSIEELAYERENKPPVAINAINSRGETALHIAAGVGCIEIIQVSVSRRECSRRRDYLHAPRRRRPREFADALGGPHAPALGLPERAPVGGEASPGQRQLQSRRQGPLARHAASPRGPLRQREDRRDARAPRGQLQAAQHQRHDGPRRGRPHALRRHILLAGAHQHRQDTAQRRGQQQHRRGEPLRQETRWCETGR